MSKKQSSLDSFFGVPKGKRVPQQAKLKFGKKNDEEKENQQIVAQDKEASFDDDNEVVVAKPSKTKQTHKKRRIIVDDDDEGEEESAVAKEPEKTATTEPEKPIEEPSAKGERPSEKSEATVDMQNSKQKATNPPSKKAKKDDSGMTLKEEPVDEEMDVATKEKENADQDMVVKPDDSDVVKTEDADEEWNEETEDEDEEPKTGELETRLKAKWDETIEKQKLSGATKTEKKSTVTTKPISNRKPLAKNVHLSYNDFCETMDEIEAITSRLEIQALLTGLFAEVLATDHPRDLYDLVYLASNSVAPSYECIELGIGDAILIKAIGEAYGTNPSIVKQKYEAEGDLGTVAKASKGKQRTLSFGVKPKPLFAKDVLGLFREIAQTTGAQSQKWKVDKIKKLLVRAQGPEAKYIIRGLQGKLRIGLARSTVLISLAHAFTQTQPEGVTQFTEGVEDESVFPEEARLYRMPKIANNIRNEHAVAIIKKAYSEVPSYDSLLDALLRVPLDQMHKACTLTPGIPVEPMLAKPTKSIQEVLKRLNGKRFTCEFKYDGERAQVHMLEDGTFKVFSRNLLDTSGKYPEVSQYVKLAAKDSVTSYVLDTEVVAFNRETGKLVPFQILSTRKKTEESDETAKVQVIVEAFDLMYLNGKSLLDKTLSERRDLMKEHFAPVESKFQYAKSLDHKEDGDTTFLEEFLETAVKSQCEGLMVKTLDDNAAYEPSRRSLNWLKLKKDYLDGIGDSVDLVPLGAYYGKGKRTGTFGAYLLACYDAEHDEYQSVCKLGTGFSDEDLKNLSQSFNDHSIEGKAQNYITSKTLDCDVWFDAVQVWEVKAADLSKSSTHKGALHITGEAGRGIGLRFPRFERVREDKKPEQATSSEQILEMYYQQDSVDDEDMAGEVDDGI